MDHPEASQRPGLDQVKQGMPIYDVHGAKVGTVSLYGLQGTHLVAERGWLFHHDMHIPLRAIQRADASGVYLLVDKHEVDDLDAEGWTSLGDVDPETGVQASAEIAGMADFADGNAAGMSTDTETPAGMPSHGEREGTEDVASEATSHDATSVPPDSTLDNAAPPA